MNSPEQDIERLLTALRDVEPPPEIERRILHTLRHRTSTPTSIWESAWTLRAATAAAVVACLTAIALHHTDPSSAPDRQFAAVRPSSATASLPASAPTSQLPPTRPAPPSNQKKNPRHPQPLSAADALALSEMRAPSHPAPPMPLTDQERLLLRIAHRGDPEEMAALSPETRAKLEAQDAADFHNFFSGHPGNN